MADVPQCDQRMRDFEYSRILRPMHSRGGKSMGVWRSERTGDRDVACSVVNSRKPAAAADPRGDSWAACRAGRRAHEASRRVSRDFVNPRARVTVERLSVSLRTMAPSARYKPEAQASAWEVLARNRLAGASGLYAQGHREPMPWSTQGCTELCRSRPFMIELGSSVSRTTLRVRPVRVCFPVRCPGIRAKSVRESPWNFAPVLTWAPSTTRPPATASSSRASRTSSRSPRHDSPASVPRSGGTSPPPIAR